MIISDYDKFDYDYQEYWKHRSYEHNAEIMLLNRLFKNVFGNYFLDIGGSYGRLTQTYYEKFENPIILDYSLKTLQKNRKVLLEKYPRLTLIAANVYYPPFKNNVFDGALMVRVLHHIEEPQKYLTQLARIMNNKGIYIQEFANKIHIKARLRALFTGKLRFFSQETYQQPTRMNFEGSNGEETVFLNFHPKYIRGLLEKMGFEIKKDRGTSFFRIPLLKRLVPEKILIIAELLSQKFFSWLHLSPSIFYKAQLNKPNATKDSCNELKDILCCPVCNSKLKFSNLSCTCSSCKAKYQKKNGIWDFRVQ